MGRFSSRADTGAYTTRMLLCTAATLLMLVALVRIWPRASNVDESGTVYRDFGDPIRIDEITQTAQAAAPPPPPLPPVPVETERDFLVEVPDMDFDVVLPGVDGIAMIGLEEPGPDERTSGPAVEEAARPIRFVEPTYTESARREKLRAEIVVLITVGAQGQVHDAAIVRCFILGDSPGDARPVEEVGFGLDDAALAAARRWVFRPARVDGEPVESRFEVTFTFGV